MPSRRRPATFAFPRRGIRILAGLALAAFLSACSTTEMAGFTSEPLATPEAGQAEVTPASEQVGSGDRIIGVLAFDEPGNLSDGTANSVYLSAKLAAATLSGNPVTIAIRRADPNPEAVQAVAQEFEALGASLVIGGNNERASADIAAAMSRSGVPTIAMTSFADLAIGLYAGGYVPNEEAVALVNEAARRGYGTIAVVATLDSASQKLAGTVSSLAAAAGMAVKGLDGTTDGQFMAGIQALVAAGITPSAVVFATGPERAAALAQGLDADDRLKGVPIVGNSGWGLAVPPPAVLKGAWYTSLPTDGLASFAERFRAQSGSAPTLNGAMTYDLLIMAAALPQAVPADPYNPEVLTNAQGFKGFTGPFRFGPTGMLEARNYLIATVQ